MNLKDLPDKELLQKTKLLVQTERETLAQILHHLREVDRRKLFSDLGYQSLFEYAVRELKYSEGQAGRRLQAMRLLKELPEMESKIASGELSLSNICQAQSYFREAEKPSAKTGSEQLGSCRLSANDKLAVLEKLENKSAREGQRILLQQMPEVFLPKEKARLLDDDHKEVRFVMNKELEEALDEVRSLLGVSGTKMSLADLLQYMAKLTAKEIKAQKFGRKRSQSSVEPRNLRYLLATDQPSSLKIEKEAPTQTPLATPTSELRTPSSLKSTQLPTTTRVPQRGVNQRYISKDLKYKIWQRDKGQCQKCGSSRNLQYDHIQPVALGGSAELQNMRLLCFSCNQRHAIKSFGVYSMRRET